jgi:hypothetical protein
LKAPPLAPVETFNLAVEGSAAVAGQKITRAAVPAEDMMQAFAYRHLVPAQELKVAVAENPRPFASNMIKILTATPVKIPAGGTASVRISTPTAAFVDRFDLELNGAPDGIAIQSVSQAASGVEMVLNCDAAKVKPGLKGNLVVNIMPKIQPTAQPAAQPAPRPGNQRRNPAGTLPAIPFEITAE